MDGWRFLTETVISWINTHLNIKSKLNWKKKDLQVIFSIYKSGINEYCSPVDDKEEATDSELQLEDFISSFDEGNDSVDDEIGTFDDCMELLDS